jgi:hypothetical protein
MGRFASLNDVLMPRLKELFSLNYGQMTLVQWLSSSITDCDRVRSVLAGCSNARVCSRFLAGAFRGRGWFNDRAGDGQSAPRATG